MDKHVARTELKHGHMFLIFCLTDLGADKGFICERAGQNETTPFLLSVAETFVKHIK